MSRLAAARVRWPPVSLAGAWLVGSTALARARASDSRSPRSGRAAWRRLVVGRGRRSSDARSTARRSRGSRSRSRRRCTAAGGSAGRLVWRERVGGLGPRAAPVADDGPRTGRRRRRAARPLRARRRDGSLASDPLGLERVGRSRSTGRPFVTVRPRVPELAHAVHRHGHVGRRRPAGLSSAVRAGSSRTASASTSRASRCAPCTGRPRPGAAS